MSTLTRYAAKNVKVMLKYAKENYSQEEYEKIYKSYNKGQKFSLVYVGIIMLAIVAVIVLSMNGGNKMIATIEDDYTADGYVKGQHITLDLSNEESALTPGERYMIHLDKGMNVESYELYSDYQAKQNENAKVVVMWGVFAIGLSFAGFVVLSQKVISKDWQEFVKKYKEDVVITH